MKIVGLLILLHIPISDSQLVCKNKIKTSRINRICIKYELSSCTTITVGLRPDRICAVSYKMGRSCQKFSDCIILDETKAQKTSEDENGKNLKKMHEYSDNKEIIEEERGFHQDSFNHIGDDIKAEKTNEDEYGKNLKDEMHEYNVSDNKERSDEERGFRQDFFNNTNTSILSVIVTLIIVLIVLLLIYKLKGFNFKKTSINNDNFIELNDISTISATNFVSDGFNGDNLEVEKTRKKSNVRIFGLRPNKNPNYKN